MGDVWIQFQIQRGGMPQRQRQVFERDIYLYVDDVVRTHSDLLRRGANIIQPLIDATYGIRELTVEDPNGFRLPFGQLL